MAVASAWAKPGSWALDSEEHESTGLAADPPSTAAAAPLRAGDFPSLATAAATKAPKKKPQAVSLSDFNAGKFTVPASRGPTPDELLNLPTGPRERSADELGRVGSLCGFGAYRGDASSGSRWGQGRGSDEPRRGGSGAGDGSSREFMPSRADEIDDWGAGKKPTVMTERRERMGGFGGDSHSRADEVDDWGAGKKSVVAPERRERMGGFVDSHSRADESASWVSNKSSAVAPAPPADARRGAPVWGFNRDSGPDSDSWGKRREEVSNGGGGSGGRPRLVLQPRTLPLAYGSDGEKEKAESSGKSKGTNPFGAARPREEVLAAKGEDWRKLDGKLEVMKVREAPPERRSFGRRGSPVAGAENGNGHAPESRPERAWRKTDAVEAATTGSEGSEIVDESVPGN